MAILPFEKPAGKSVLRASAQGSIASIDMFGVIGGDFWGDGGITKEQFAKMLDGVGKDVKQVDVRMSSPGGDVFDGRAIANMIQEHPAKFNINVIAEASSIASVIAMAGDTVTMSEGAVMLVHRCYAFTIGNSVELRKLASDLETLDNGFIATYVKKTGMKPQDLMSLMDENRYMNAEEAKSRGFVDVIAGEKPKAEEILRIAALSVDRARFHLPPLNVNKTTPLKEAGMAALARIKALKK